MDKFNRLIYTWLGIFFFVMLPMFLYASNHVRNRFPGNEFIVSAFSGKAFVAYDIRYELKDNKSKPLKYHKKSDLVPLAVGMQISSGGKIFTGANTIVDLLREDRFSIRIVENSNVKISRNDVVNDCYGVALEKGKILCNATQSVNRRASNKSEFLSIRTPGVTSCVKGTVFSVGFAPESVLTEVAVMEGLVSTGSSNSGGFNFNVSGGKKAIFKGTNPIPTMCCLGSEDQCRLQAARKLKVESSAQDKWDQTMDLVIESPLYKKALSLITDYEMKIFKRAIIYKARLIWDGAVPDTLRDVELEDGDYEDPWNTEYFYEKLDRERAVLISAGNDKILHTADDLFMAIQL
ncbi:MAG: FecR domain-containing protein [Desulfobacterales bacterium]|nr:FecR domain-containing protein [Desulfobacterales bacterium]